MARRPRLVAAIAILLLATLIPGPSAGLSANAAGSERSRPEPLIVEGWRRLVMGPYDSPAAARAAWRPILKALAVVFEQPSAWQASADPLTKDLNALLSVAITPGRTQHRRQALKASAGRVVCGNPQTVMWHVWLRGECRAGDTPSGRTRVPCIALLFWRQENQLRYQNLREFRDDGWWLYANGRADGRFLAFAGNLWAGGNWARPALLLYRKAGRRWVLVQMVCPEPEGQGDWIPGPVKRPLPDVRITWNNPQWHGEVLTVSHAGAWLFSFEERWVFRRGRYRRISLVECPTSLAALDHFIGALQRHHCRAARRYVLDPKLITAAVGLGLHRPVAWIWDEIRSDREYKLTSDTARLRVRLTQSRGRFYIVGVKRDPGH